MKWPCEQRFSLLDHSPFPGFTIVKMVSQFNVHLNITFPVTYSLTEKAATFDHTNYRKVVVEGHVIHIQKSGPQS